MFARAKGFNISVSYKRLLRLTQLEGGPFYYPGKTGPDIIEPPGDGLVSESVLGNLMSRRENMFHFEVKERMLTLK